jgi:hypothetical protein
MRKLLNRLLIKFGLLLTKAPTLLSDHALKTSQLFAAELTERVKVGAATEPPPITMLEIGVFRGGSLRMWKKYFHPDSTIVGIDVDESCQAHEIADQNVFVRIGSQADPNFLAEVNGEFGPFDIILDDGSHKTHHQIISFGALFRDALKDCGCYMVEDVHTNYWIKHVDSPETFIDLSKQMIDMLHEPYFDRKETAFRHEHPEALKELELSYLSANLDSISFHDSIVVFDKRKQSLPKCELR